MQRETPRVGGGPARKDPSEGLGTALRGSLVRRTDPGYDDARKVYDAMIGLAVPSGILSTTGVGPAEPIEA